MKHTKNILITIFSLIIASSLHAQTAADGIIGSYIDAIGGHDKMAQIKSIYIEATMSVMGNDAPTKTTILNGKGYKSEMDFSGQQIVNVVTDKGGWMINPFMGSPDPAPMPNDIYVSYKDEIWVGGPLLNYSTNGYLVKLLGSDVVDGKPVYKIEAISPDSVKTTFFIDSATHLLNEEIKETSGQTTLIKLSNYQKTDYGVLMPYSEDITAPQGVELTITVTKVEVNKDVDPSIFNMPGK